MRFSAGIKFFRISPGEGGIEVGRFQKGFKDLVLQVFGPHAS